MPKEVPKVLSKELPKEVLKELPKELPKETPKEVPKKELPKELPKESTNINVNINKSTIPIPTTIMPTKNTENTSVPQISIPTFVPFPTKIQEDKPSTSPFLNTETIAASVPKMPTEKIEKSPILPPHIPQQANQGQKKVSLQQAKQEINDFCQLIDKLEKEIYDKYNIKVSEFYYDDLYPEDVSIKLVDEFFKDKKIADIKK